MHLPHARAMKRLEADLAAIEDQITKNTNAAEECDKDMKELKVVLYAKFGSAINLDEWKKTNHFTVYCKIWPICDTTRSRTT